MYFVILSFTRNESPSLVRKERLLIEFECNLVRKERLLIEFECDLVRKERLLIEFECDLVRKERLLVEVEYLVEYMHIYIFYLVNTFYRIYRCPLTITKNLFSTETF